MSTYTGPIENIVVLMLENRSFDNVLGALYANSPTFEGLTFKEVNYTFGSTPVAYTIQNNPNSTAVPPIDPGEAFMDMNLQIYGNTGGSGSEAMSGFVMDYLATSQEFPDIVTSATNICYPALPRMDKSVTPPAAANGQDMMNYFTTAGTSPQLPVTSALAQAFGVSDSWFGSCPTQTFPNRLFLHCGTSGGYVDDCEYAENLQVILNFPSVFELLDNTFGVNNSPPNWKVYFHDYSIAWMIDYVWKAFNASQNVNVCSFDNCDFGSNSFTPTFLDDVANKTLPKYSFIEPRYGNLTRQIPNSNHPPFDMIDGEALLATIYNALRNSSYWDKLLFIVIYDEHGGCYDHVAPPTNATPPGSNAPVLPNPTYTFPGNRFGPRVPALIISPYVPAGSIFRPANFTPGVNSTGVPFDHTSVIATLNEVFGTGTLWDRANAAPGLASLLTSPSNINNGPQTVPVPVPTCTSSPSSPLNVEDVIYQHLLPLISKVDRLKGKL